MSLARPTACLSLLAALAGWIAAPAAPAPAQDQPAETAAPTARATPTLEALSWMTGRWVMEAPGQHLEETWGHPRGDALVGTFRWNREGRIWLYELMSVEEDEDGRAVFRLRHFSRELEPWASEADGPLVYPLAESAPNRVVFENPDRDEPRRFLYSRAGDVLTVRLEGPDPEGPADEFSFTLAAD